MKVPVIWGLLFYVVLVFVGLENRKQGWNQKAKSVKALEDVCCFTISYQNNNKSKNVINM